MSEHWEDIVQVIFQKCCPDVDMSKNVNETKRTSLLAKKAVLEGVSSELVHTFSSDAVRAAKSLTVHIFDPIRTALEPQLFGTEWEDVWTKNELARALTATIEDFLGDVKTFLSEFLIQKVITSMAAATAVFYIECLVKKAGAGGNVEVSHFIDNERALQRISGDMKVINEYFRGFSRDMPVLARKIEDRLQPLSQVHEFMTIAAGLSTTQAPGSILALYKRIRNVEATEWFARDLWCLVNPKEEETLMSIIEAIEPRMIEMEPVEDMRLQRELKKLQIPGLYLDDMVTDIYSFRENHFFEALISNLSYELELGPQLTIGEGHFSTTGGTKAKRISQQQDTFSWSLSLSKNTQSTATSLPETTDSRTTWSAFFTQHILNLDSEVIAL